MAPTLRDATSVEIEARLAELRAEGPEPALRTSVLTHMAWVPREWEQAAEQVMKGLGERHPSRTIVLYPDSGASSDRCDAEVSLQVFEADERSVYAETIRIWLRGSCAQAPASVVVPLQIPDLPVFLRWRGQPPFGEPELEQLVGVTDRLIVDSAEWPDLPRAYAPLAGLFECAAVSDLAWARTLGHRAGLADLWPGIAKAKELRVKGPRAEALLLHGWLRSRLERKIRLAHEEAALLALVAVDGERAEPPPADPKTPSDLLSDQLEVFTRDPVYEAAVRAAAGLRLHPV